MASSTQPGSRTTLTDVLDVLDRAAAAGVRLWLDGGWGVDALLGRQTRPHADLDVVLGTTGLAAFVRALSVAGFEPVGEPGATAWNFLLARPDGVVVDVHGVEFDAAGAGVLGPPEAGNAYPPGALTGRGTLGARAVGCVAPAWAVAFHDAYVGDDEDRADVRALCERFGLDLPAQYR